MIHSMQIPAWFRNTEPGKQMIEEATKSEQAKRQAMRDAIHSVETKAAKLLPKLQTAEGKARQERDEVAETLTVKERNLQLATQARRSASNRAEREVRDLQRQLEDGSPSEIDSEINRIDRAFDRIRATEIHIDQRVSGYNMLGAPIRTGDSNVPDIRGKLERLRAARQALSDLRLAAPSDWDSAIAEIVNPVEELLK